MDAVRRALTGAPIEVTGRLVSASNTTLLCSYEFEGQQVRCVYKPTAGERPLWDFGEGTLGRREVATALLADAIAEITDEPSLVPPTVWRTDGPFGEGMCQLWIEDAGGGDVDIVLPEEVPANWLVSVSGVDGRHREVLVVHDDRPDLRRLALFDLMINNADRKGGHILRDPAGRLLAIDHGVTMHTEEKLRTVLGGWGGKDLDPAEIDLLRTLGDLLGSELRSELAEWLDVAEVSALRRRIRGLLRRPRFPEPSGDWPAIPWPVF